MAEATLEQVARLADQLTPEEKRALVERLSRQLQPLSGSSLADTTGGIVAKQPKSLRGIWRGHFPEDLDVDKVLHDIRHEWEKELDEVVEE